MTDQSLVDVSDAFSDFLRVLRHQRGRAAAVPEADELTLPQYHLLGPLDEGPAGLCDLAELAGVAAPTASRMLDGLEGRGLVVRERRTDDRRAVEIRLTAEGERLLARKRAAVAERRAAVFADFSEAERRDAARLLERLAGAVEAFR